jgi:dipeptidyl aminopeptidase/acylaminoacyl peptidase
MLQKTWIAPAMVLVLSTIKLYAGPRTFTVRDSIEMTTLSDPNSLEKDGQVKFSPDGKHFLVVSTRGILQSDQLESCLMVFDINRIRFSPHGPTDFPQPLKCLAHLAAVPRVEPSPLNQSTISDARWSPDSKSIYYLGQGLHAERHLYRVYLATGNQRELTPSGYDVIRFDCSRQAVVYVASRTPDLQDHFAAPYGKPINRDALDVTGVGLTDLLFPRMSRATERIWQVWAIKGDRHPTIIGAIAKPLTGYADIGHEVLSMSPDGREAVILVPIRRVLQQWDSYEAGPGFKSWRIHAKNADPSTITSSGTPLKQYALIDLRTRRMIPLIDAPVGTALGYFDQLKAIWSEDGRRLLITNTFLPIEASRSADEDRPLRPCAIAAIEVASLSTRCIVTARRQALEGSENRGAWWLQDVSFGADSDEVFTEFDTPQQKRLIETYHNSPNGWVGPSNISGSSISTKRSPKIEVHIRQSLNDPPTLWATDVATGKQAQVWDPNPRLKEISYGEASLYHWQDSSGYKWTGILVKPVGYTPREQYPLVIQTHGFIDYAFVTNGLYPTAMAARPLASVGIAVLQTDYRHDIVGPQEGEADLEKYEGAVRQLTSDGLIDPKRVGVIGFSRTCWQVENSLIERPRLFRAATIADGIDNSYMQYHLFGVGTPALAAQFEKSNNGKPFGEEGIKQWLYVAPGFRLDKVLAPVRIEALGAISILSEWELYSSLRLQGKPVDLIYIPDGQHILQKPLEKLASEQGNVDWFRFWLQNYERPHPDDPEQYKRWEHLRDLRDAQDKSDGQPNAANPH